MTLGIHRCPRCRRLSVSFDYRRGKFSCHHRTCNWFGTREQVEEAETLEELRRAEQRGANHDD